MKYLKKFENFDLGRFGNEEENNHDWVEDVEEVEDDYTLEDEDLDDEDEIEDEENEMRRRVWGDEVVEKKKMNAGFKAYLDKQKSKKSDKKDDKDEDKKPKKEDEKESKGKGLTTAQKKLPEGLRKAIEAKNKKK